MSDFIIAVIKPNRDGIFETQVKLGNPFQTPKQFQIFSKNCYEPAKAKNQAYINVV